jgi:hypothetical protein
MELEFTAGQTVGVRNGGRSGVLHFSLSGFLTTP